MARLFGIIGNRPDLAARVLAHESEALRARSKGAPLGWGLAFYQGGEVLMRRRPIDERPEIDVAGLASDVRADLVVGHVRQATVGALRTENTHPFRYRQWVFAQTGTISEFDNIRDRLGEKVVHFQHLDAPVTHLGDEVEMVALGVLDPQHVVEQQVVAIARRQPLVGASGRADHHLAELPYLGMHAEFRVSLRHDHDLLVTKFPYASGHTPGGLRQTKSSAPLSVRA